jgi:hypothetical protein
LRGGLTLACSLKLEVLFAGRVEIMRTRNIARREGDTAMKRIVVFLLIGVLGVAISAAPVQRQTPVETRELQPVKDTALIESAAGDLASSTGDTIFVGRTGQAERGKRRGLIAFDFANAIPARSRIVSVSLTMTVQISAGGPRPTPVRLYRVLKSWGEGTSASEGARGAQAEAGDATWIHRVNPTLRWARPGGDYSRVVSATEEVSGPGTYTWKSTARLVADVQSWVNSPKGNFGWILIGDESRAATAKVFKSRESTDEAVRPQLTVTFRPPAK